MEPSRKITCSNNHQFCKTVRPLISLYSTYRPLSAFGFSIGYENITSSLTTSERAEKLLLGAGVSLFDKRLKLGIDLRSPTLDWVNAQFNYTPHFTMHLSPTRNIRISFQADDDLNLYAGVRFGLGPASFESAGLQNSSASGAALLFESGDDSDLSVAIKKRYVPLEIEGTYSYSNTGDSYFRLLSTVKAMAEDSYVKGIVLIVKSNSLGFGQLKEIRDIIDKSKKHAIAFLPGYISLPSYYLASVASAIYTQPSNSFDASGLSSERFYMSNLLI